MLESPREYYKTNIGTGPHSRQALHEGCLLLLPKCKSDNRLFSVLKPFLATPPTHCFQDNMRALDRTLEALHDPSPLPTCPYSLTPMLQLPHWGCTLHPHTTKSASPYHSWLPPPFPWIQLPAPSDVWGQFLYIHQILVQPFLSSQTELSTS